MFDFPAPATPGQIFAPGGPGTEPAYTFDGVGWVYGATTQLLISSLLPNSALCGSAAQTVRALGANFTATCELLLDGVAQATTYVSVSELTFQVNPVPETVPRTAIVTVQDGATAGVGAVPFSFTIVTTYIWNIGIDETVPGTIDVRPANTNGEIGGVTVTPRDATTQGLALDLVTGALAAPPATPLLMGVLTEPPADSKGYVRQTTGVVSTWVPPADTPLPDFGIGLSLDTSTDPDIVHLQPAGDSPATLGGVYVIDRVRNNTEGLELGIDGRLRVPVATDSLLGGILEPPPDDKGYVRRRTTTGVSAWVPPADPAAALLGIEFIVPNTAPVGAVPLVVEVHGTAFTATTVAIFDGAARATTYVSPTELMFQIDPTLETVRVANVTVQDTVGPVNGTGVALFHFVPATALYRGTYSPSANLPDIWAARQLGYMWIVDTADPNIPEFSGVPGLAGLALNEGDHLVYDGTQYNLVDGNQTASMYQGFWKPATNVPTIDAMVKYPGYMWIADTNIPNTPESPPAGFPDLAGLAIYEGDMIVWDGLNFKLMQGVLVPNYRGLWNVASNTPPIDQPAVGNNKPNWMWLAKTVDPNVPEIAPATMPGIGGLTISEGDHIVWDKPNYAFIRISGGLRTDYGVGLSVSPGADPGDPQIVNLTPAGDSTATLGGVYVIDRVRNNTEGLELGIDGRLRVPPATDSLLGGILEPPADDKGYVRRRTVAGDSAWVPPADSASLEYRVGLFDRRPTENIIDLKYAGENGEIGGVKVIGRSPVNGLEFDLTTHILTAPLATDVAAGAIVEPKPDGLQYVRTRSTAGVSSWVESTASRSLVPVGRSPVNGLDSGFDATLQAETIFVPLATELLAGSMVEPPADDLQYARTRSAAGVSTWVPVVSGGIQVADTPPTGAAMNTLWWDSDSGDLFVNYQDADSLQWVQINTAAPPTTGIPEAPNDGQMYVRQSGAWVVLPP